MGIYYFNVGCVVLSLNNMKKVFSIRLQSIPYSLFMFGVYVYMFRYTNEIKLLMMTGCILSLSVLFMISYLMNCEDEIHG